MWFDEKPHLPYGTIASGPPSTAADLFKVNFDSRQDIENWNSTERMLEEIYDRRNKEIMDATGKELPNPMRAARPTSTMDGFDLDPTPFDPEGDWQRSLKELAGQYPDKAGVLQPDFDPRDEIRQRRRESEDRMMDALSRRGRIEWNAIPFVSPLAAEVANLAYDPVGSAAIMAGQMAGMYNSPVDVIPNLFIGLAGGPTQSLLKNALKAAVSNVALQAAYEPGVQARRADAGLESGWEQAFQNLAGAFVMGGVIDPVIRAPIRYGRIAAGSTETFGGVFRDAPPPLAPKLPGDLTPETLNQALAGDQAAVEKVVEAMGLQENPTVRGALQQIEQEAGLRAEGVDGPDADDALSQAIAAARNSEEPLPGPFDPELDSARQQRVVAIETELETLRQGGVENADRIATLEQERARLRNELEAKAREAAIADDAPETVQKLTADGKPVSGTRIKTADLTVDRQQFPSRSSPQALANRPGWDPLAAGRILVWERTDGSKVVVDGRNRVDYAKKTGTDEVEGYVYREADGWTAGDMQVQAALKSLRDGKITDPVDAALVLRARPELVTRDLAANGQKSKLVRSLTRLSPAAFERVVAGEVEPVWGGMVADLVARADQHDRILTDLAALNPRTQREGRLAIAELLRVPRDAATHAMILDVEAGYGPGVLEARVAVLDIAMRDLQTDKRTFDTVVKQAQRLVEEGNQLLPTANVARAGANELAMGMLNYLVNQGGPVANLLNEAALAVATQGLSPKLAGAAFAGRLRQIMQGDALAAVFKTQEPPLRIDEPWGKDALRQVEEAEAALRGAIEKARTKEIDDDTEALFALARYEDENPLNREAKAVTQALRTLEDAMKREGRNSTEIAAEIKQQFGLDVDPERIETGEVWWRIGDVMRREADLSDLFGRTENEVLGQLGEDIYVDLDRLEAPELPEGIDPAELVSRINERPDAPQIMADIAANPQDAPRIIGLALTDDIVARATQMYLEQDMGPAEIAATLMRETRKYVRLDQLTKLLTEADQRARGGNQRRVWSEVMTEMIQSVADRLTSGVKLAEQLGLQAQQVYNRRSDLKKAGKAVPELAGTWKAEDRLWWSENPEAVAALQSPEIRRMTAPDAAEVLGKQFGAKLTPLSIRSARSRYGASSQSAAPARMVTINRGDGKQVFRVVRGSKVEYTTTNAEKAKARLNELLVKSIDDDTDTVFALPRDTDGQPSDRGQSASTGGRPATGDGPGETGALSPGRPGETDARVQRFPVGSGGSYAVLAPRGAGPDGTRSWDLKVFSPTATAVPSEGASSTVTRNAWRSVGNQIAKLELEERAAGPWDATDTPILLTVRNVEVRKDRQGQGVGTALYDAIEAHFGVQLVPSGFLKEGGFKFWQKRNPDAVKHYQYVPHQDTYMSPNQIVGHYKLTKRALMFAADDLDRNNLKTAVRELKGAIDAIDWAEVSDQRLRSEFALPRTGEAPSGIEIGKYGFTPEAQARIALIRERVQAVFDRLPPAVKGNLIDSLTYGGKDVDGSFNPTDAMVWVSLRAQDPERVAMHEEIHVLRKLKLLTDDEYNVLVQYANQIGARKTYDIDKRYKKIYERKFGKGARLEQALVEEMASEMAADYKTGTRFSPAIDRILAKIIDVLDQVFRAVSGLGFRQVTDVFRPVLSVEQVMQRIRSGEVGRRPADLSGLGRRDGTGQILQQDRATGQAMRRELDSLGFYSKLDEVLGTFGPKDKVTTATLAQRGVKAAELEARGLGQMLADGKAVPVADLRAAAEQNKVQLKQSVYRGKPYDPYDDNQSVTSSRPAKWAQYSLDPDNLTYRETVIHLPDSKDAASQRVNAAAEAAKQWIRDRGEDPADYEYKMPEDYVTLAVDKFGMPRPEGFDADIRAVTDLAKASADKNFRSGHFPEPNIVGHMMTSMTTHQGKSVYTIDQIQSDWGQKLRDGGVRDEAKIAEWKNKLTAATKAVEAEAVKATAELDGLGVPPTGMAPGPLQTSAGDANIRIHRVLNEYRRIEAAGDSAKIGEALAVVDAVDAIRARLDKLEQERYRIEAELKTYEATPAGNPLVNTTDQWVTTTLRRAITQAVEANADYIAIPSGDTVLGYNPGDTKGMREFYGATRVRDAARLAEVEAKLPDARRALKAAEDASDETRARNAKQTTPNSAKELVGAREALKAAHRVVDDLLKQKAALEEASDKLLTGIVPKNLAKLLGTKGERIDTLDSPSGKTGLGKGFTLFPLTDEMKMRVRFEGMPMFSIRAFHGSPHDFDRFDLSKIGTGEGAQAYGHGLYFAESEGVAKQYRTDLRSRIPDIELSRAGVSDDVALQAKTYLSSSGNDPLEASRKLRAVADKAYEDLRPDILKAADAYERAAQHPGRMYEVRIDADPNDFLDWDKPLSQQSEKVREAFRDTLEPIAQKYEQARAGLADVEPRYRDAAMRSADQSIADARAGNMTVGHYLDVLAKGSGNAEASRRLKEIGIPGIKYLDQGSRGSGEGTYNFVVFDDSIIKIVAKDGQPLDDGTLASGLKETDRLGTEADLISVCRR